MYFDATGVSKRNSNISTTEVKVASTLTMLIKNVTSEPQSTAQATDLKMEEDIKVRRHLVPQSVIMVGMLLLHTLLLLPIPKSS